MRPAALLLAAAGLVFAAPVSGAEEEAAAVGGAENGSASRRATITLPLGLSLHRPNYALPVTWTDDASGSEDIEFKYQLSFKYQVAQQPVFVAYTQTAYFRWLDEDDSRPFRETNYNPEVWYRFRPGRLEPDWLGLDIGYEHESNGEDLPQSRSWDRVYARPWFDQGAWSGSLKFWSRLPEGDPSTPDNPDGDDNPDIVDYYGHHELRLEYTFADGDRLAGMSRYSFSDQRGALRLEYATPTGAGSGYWFIQFFSGYGESLETFKQNRNRIGIGFALLN